ncbi:FAD-dependent monooxygenase [Jatrophihabitans sp. YIM 134969]
MLISDKDAVDVVVVGAGPVGLLLGAELALGGARVAVLDRLTEPVATIRAGSINVASAELLGRRGLLDQLRAAQAHTVEAMAAGVGGVGAERLAAMARRGVRAAHFAAIPLDATLANDDDRRLAGHLEAVDATFVPQQALETVLAAHAARSGVQVHRGVVFAGCVEDGTGITVETDHGSIRASWLVGCDGGRSAVRHAAGFEFPGTDPEITGRQAVVELADDSGLNRGWNWSTRGVYCYGPTPGRVLTVEFGGAPTERDAPVTADEVQRSLRRVTGLDVEVTGLRGAATRWTDNARQATTYRLGRVLLAGDAAHVHSPFSGQGLNLGLGDAMNLGWKLAAVVTGRSPASLLDTYSAERHPVGAWVLDWTRAQIALMRPDDKVGPLRAVVGDLVGTRDGMTHMVAEISGVARRVLHDEDDPAVGRTVPDLTLDDGASLRDAFTAGLFVLAGPDVATDLVRPWAGRVRTVALQGRRALLARPDGVIAWTGDVARDPAGLQCALRRWIGGERPTSVPT